MSKLKPMRFERDKHGSWVHPVYEETWRELFGDVERLTVEQAATFMDALGVDLKHLTLESDPNITLDAWKNIHEEVDLSNWCPKIPEGYFEAGYWFTEDDAVAVFAKERI